MPGIPLTENYEFHPSMDLGIGLDYVTSAPLSVGVVGEAVPLEVAPGQDSFLTASHIKSETDFNQITKFSAGVEARYFIFSASAKVEFTKSVNIHEYSNFVAIYQRTINAPTRLNNPQLTDEARHLLEQRNLSRFHERFGHVFVSTIITGGEYTAVFEFRARNSAEMESTKTSIRAGADAGVFAANVTLDSFQGWMRSIATNEMRVTSWTRGGNRREEPQTVEQAFQRAREMPIIARDAPIAFGVVAQPYQILALPYDDLTWIDMENANQVMRETLDNIARQTKLRNSIKYVLNHQTEFVDVDVPRLNALHELLTQNINTLTDNAKACARDPLACRFVHVDVPDFTPRPILRADSGRVVIPDFTGSRRSGNALLQLATEHNVLLRDEQGGDLGALFSISVCDIESQSPNPGEITDRPAVVRLRVSRSEIDPSIQWVPSNRIRPDYSDLFDLRR
ncbi:hypothetical protein [Leptolyngbya sp. FACHB-711]|uniref:hypothetical protein n=1 Tax=unclassified Leptolyngbya TaxID=2650499 RepID=UPI0016848C89|nr:hypothetical protein [Leptolyngbya sp. FACHB-711]MBD2024983.1 hypothetical protein [Leptolyngbya sp. FACHB-711]